MSFTRVGDVSEGRSLSVLPHRELGNAVRVSVRIRFKGRDRFGSECSGKSLHVLNPEVLDENHQLRMSRFA